MTTSGFTSVRSGLVRVNGTNLYQEVRGTGPGLLCISGAFGDAGYWPSVADQLSDRFTVVSYDRRGNSRSAPAPSGVPMSMAEQADDAAALIEANGLAPATVLGSSGAAIVLLELIARHPEVVQLALVHEPPLLAILPNGAEVGAELRAMTEQGLAQGGPRAAAELFIRTNAGDKTFESFDPDLRERLLGNAETFLATEVEQFVTYQPDVARVRTSGVQIIMLLGADSGKVYYADATRRMADALGCPIAEVPGAHVPYLTCPDAFVETIRPLIEPSTD